MVNRDHIETFNLDLYPDYTVTVALFRDVTNMSEIRASLLAGKLNCALLNVDVIADVFTLLQACNKAVYSNTNQSMKTRKMHTEILYNLSPSKKIKDALNTFGVNDTQQALIGLCLRESVCETDGIESLVEMVDGATAVSLKDIEQFCDKEKLMKLYKITKEELSVGSLADAIALRVATKDAI